MDSIDKTAKSNVENDTFDFTEDENRIPISPPPPTPIATTTISTKKTEDAEGEIDSDLSALALVPIQHNDPFETSDVALVECMEKLGTRLTVLESELQYAWKALDLLSQEYVIMWNRMEKAEALLTQQQAVIAKMIEEQVEESEEAKALYLSRKRKEDDDTDGGGLGESRSRGGNHISSSHSSTSPFGGYEPTRATRTPDEAFYRYVCITLLTFIIHFFTLILNNVKFVCELIGA